MKYLNLLVVLGLISILGCTIKGGDVIEEDLNKIVTCIDTRDGEEFSFNTNTITDIRQGFGSPSSIDVVTNQGKKMTIHEGMGSWLKCEKSD